MTDNFEKFIQKNREQFDMLEPSPELWKKVEKNIGKKKTLPLKKYISWAAAVAVIFTISFLCNNYIIKNDIQIAHLFQKKNVAIPELQEAEMYYAGVIDDKLEEMKPLLASYPSLENELLMELSDLDSIYRNMKEDLKDNIANREVIEAMIQNYRLRVSILEDILSQFKEEEKENNKDNDNNKETPKNNSFDI